MLWLGVGVGVGVRVRVRVRIRSRGRGRGGLLDHVEAGGVRRDLEKPLLDERLGIVEI